MFRLKPGCCVAACLFAIMTPLALMAQEKLEPTAKNVSYGPHERNVLDFWKAESEGPAPLVIYIHGGGFRNGSKESLNQGKLRQLLDAGISVAALNYRLLAQERLPAAHHDCRRAVQFLRTKSKEWNLDGGRFGAFGGSAGAQICMYLAFHDEMAKPESEDPIERQSTRLKCVATSGGQTTMDFRWWRENIPGYEKPHREPAEYFGEIPEETRLKIIEDIAALKLLTKDDPPIYMQYGMAPNDPEPADQNRVQGWRVHHVNFGVALLEKAKKLDVPAYLRYRGANPQFPADVEFFRHYLLLKNGDAKKE